ncbi:MAG: histidine phosphatase family protein [Acidimicrobiales bacterium]
MAGPTLSQLVLVRHGESTWNELKLVQGQSDASLLTEEGRAQARAVAVTLRQQRFDAILASDLWRAIETAEILGDAMNLPVETAIALRERSFGLFEGRPLAHLTPLLSGIEHGQVVNDLAHPERGETLRALQERSGAFVEHLRHSRPNQRLLLVTHGGTIRAIRAHCAGITMMGLPWDRVANCSVWNV